MAERWTAQLDALKAFSRELGEAADKLDGARTLFEGEPAETPYPEAMSISNITRRYT